ncbi:MAG: NADH-quinone oxidoreductase subunit N [Acidobacteria bacterium]|nr:NADH-quinone oxidoreductase subunit N [Acidobacteriota bacterium]MBS1867588.1 NADH-quinone oxidoreductase subunit N [Acidobacteriota bacterium]
MNNALPNLIDIRLVYPEIVWCSFGLALMLLQPFIKNRHFFTFLGLVGAIGGTVLSIVSGSNYGPGFSGLIRFDAFSLFFHLLLGTVAFLVVLASESYLERENLDSAEFLALVLFATAGMGVLASAQELLTAFIGLEMSSISSYILAGYRRDALKSSESALKYFLLGSFATAFFLYGIALVYGATHTTLINEMSAVDPASGYLKLGLAMILIGLGFKVAAAPFQIWTPDVYDGAPTPVTALFSAGPKAAAFALLLRIFASVPAATHYWFWAFWILAALTMFLGNLGALVQTNVKRLLAYSSIAHAGYILVAFAAVTSMAAEDPALATPAYAAILFYLLSYALVKVGAFTIVSQLGGAEEKSISLDDYAGLGQRQPWVAASLTIFLLSLLGLPVTAGFFGKFYIFAVAIHSKLIWLAIMMAINSIIGAYYYLRLIVIMYMHEPRPEAAATTAKFPLTATIVLFVTVAGTLYFGLAPTKTLAFLNQKTLIGSIK